MPNEGDRPSPPQPSDFTRTSDVGATVSTPESQPKTGPKPPGHAPTFSAATVAGRYRVVRFIAEGGMGEVYEAEDLELGGRVALKTIKPEIVENDRAVERFKREIHIARKITHPNVSRVYDFGRHAPESGADVLFLTMELLPGPTLSQQIGKKKRLTKAEALPLARHMAAGLDAAHAAGVIHRDFKSGNVMLVPSPGSGGGTRAVITDFGLARGVGPHEGSLASISDTGAVIGTPAYMAPEQVQGLTLSPAADIYAFGIVLYEMMTGSRPFGGGSAMSVATRRLLEPPQPPKERVLDLDVAWNDVILRCLERDPSARFATAGDVVRALEERRESPSAQAFSQLTTAVIGESPRKPWARHPFALFAIVLVGALIGYGVWLRRTAAQSPRTSASPSAPAPVAARRVVAALGFKNASGRADAAWISAALVELVTTELSGGGELRVISPPETARVKRELNLADSDALAKEALARLRRALGVDGVAVGSYTLIGSTATPLLRIDLVLQDATSGAVVASGSASGADTQLVDLVSRASPRLREGLGLGPQSPAESLQVAASLPSKPEAARRYAEGLSRLESSDAAGARDALQKAAIADPGYAMTHLALARAWSALGYETKARAAAKKAGELAEALAPELKLLVQARFHETSRDWDDAITSYQALLTAFPDSLEYGLALADVQTRGGRPREALVTLANLGKLPSPAVDDASVDLTEARTYQELNDFRREQALAARAALKAAANGAPLLVARARLLEATAYDGLGEPKKSQAAVDEARGLYETAGDKGGLARALNQMASGLSAQGDLDDARRLFERALALNRQIGDERTAAIVLQNLGNVMFDQGQTAQAQKLYEESLSTFRKIDAKYEAALALNDIGARLQNKGDLGGAEKRYHEALTILQATSQPRGVALTLTNLAEVRFLLGDLKEAEEMHKESLAINREIGDKSGAAYDLYRLGEVNAARGDLRAAASRYNEAADLQDQLGEKVNAAQTRLGLASLSLAEGKPEAAERAARDAEEILRTAGADDLRAGAGSILAGSLLRQRKVDEARRSSEEANALAAKSEDRHVRTTTAIVVARVRAASGQPADADAALQSLESARAGAAQAGFVGDAYEARLAMGEVEISSGRVVAGKARLRALADEAEAHGFGLVAKRARASSTSS